MTSKLFTGNPLCDQSNQIFSEKSPIHELLHDVVVDDNGSEIVFSHSDVFLLFNQDRIERTLGVDTLRSWLNDVRPNNSPNLSSSFSDDELGSFVKSKYVQSLSEVSDWYNYLRQNTTTMRQTLERFVKEHSKSDESDKSDKTDKNE